MCHAMTEVCPVVMAVARGSDTGNGLRYVDDVQDTETHNYFRGKLENKLSSLSLPEKCWIIG